MKEQFPIHSTCPGPDFGTIVEEAFTHNPIPEETYFEVKYKNFTIKFRLNMHFYTCPNISVIEVMNVKKQPIKRPMLNGQS